jgi:putative DNA primase/helicase
MMDPVPLPPSPTPRPTKSRGSGGSGGSTTRKPAENRQKSGPDAGTPKQNAGGSTGSGDDVETPGAGDLGERATGTDQANPAEPADKVKDADYEPDDVNDDPFRPLGGADGAAPETPGGKPDADDFEVVPFEGREVDLKREMFQTRNLPNLVALWPYRLASGLIVGVVARYLTGDGGKDIRPWRYGRKHANHKPAWHQGALPAPRPLYMPVLAERPDAPVLVCEGEKTADAAAALFPDHVCITSQGGSGAAAKSDWSPLAGRAVTIWPDHDEPGAGYAKTVAALATAAGVASVRVVAVPSDWPACWDLADPLPDGVTDEDIAALLADASDVAGHDAGVRFPPHYEMTPSGLFYTPPAKKGDTPGASIFVAAQFQVIGETRSDTGEGWGLLLQWRDRENRDHQWAIPRKMIHRPGNEIAAELEDAGLSCGSGAAAHELLKGFVGAVKVKRMLRCVASTGWHHDDKAATFVLPGGEAFGRGAEDVILQAEYVHATTAYRMRGNLDDWQRDVAALAVGNDLLAFTLAAGFCGPLLDVVGEPSGGIHLVGASRSGKSTAAMIAGSVWGPPLPDGQMRQWRATANGLEGAAAETRDTLLILDELGQADPREVADVVYMLSAGSGKQRATRTGSARLRQSWRVLFVSTGEVTLAAKMGEAGKRLMAGLEVRLAHLPADAGAGMGVFQELHGRASAAALVEELGAAAQAHHGTAARAFLARLAQDMAGDANGLRDALRAMREGFIAHYVPAGSAAQVRSVASRFALIGAAGELARDYAVLPWPEGESLRAAGACLKSWVVNRGGAGSGEDALAIAQVRAFIEQHGESRFTWLRMEPDDGTKTINRAGYRRKAGDILEFLILSEAWKNEICKGLDAKRTADLLAARGWLVGGDDRHRSALVTVPGEGKLRLYVVRSSIMGGVDAE